MALGSSHSDGLLVRLWLLSKGESGRSKAGNQRDVVQHCSTQSTNNLLEFIRADYLWDIMLGHKPTQTQEYMKHTGSFWQRGEKMNGDRYCNFLCVFHSAQTGVISTGGTNQLIILRLPPPTLTPRERQSCPMLIEI